MSGVFDFLDGLADTGDLDAVERAALDAMAGAAEADVEDLWRYVAWARFEQGRLRGVLDAARTADDALYEAKARFHLWEFAEAEEALARCPGEGEDGAEAEWYRGLLAEFKGRDGDACFRCAATMAPEVFHEPVRLGEAEIDSVIHDAMQALPSAVSAAVQETAIELRPLPRPYPDVDPLSLGLYIGIDRLQRSLEDATGLPPRIEIYRLNIERIARDRAEAVDELRITLLHEIGHHLGFDEAGVESLGLG